jgi:sigma-70-like protein
VVSRAEVFDRNRPLLFSIAYRMTGSVMEAEDAVQEAYLRWQRASEYEVRSPSAFLSKVVTRLCIARFESSPQQEERLLEGFLRASLSGEMEALLELLSDDVTLYSDGGGKTRAALRPVYGADNVARFLTGILRNIPPGFAVKQTRVNGRPGLVGYFGDGSPQSVVTLEVAEGSIRAIRLVVNPEKLGNVPPLAPSQPTSAPSGSHRRA